ncbi:hypothetical protein GGH96_005379 [Coemansia sp. RSA 1972]|nr:hypothetical protein GGH96_005379 [Coemansia sp. RSA 1972]
MDEVYEVERIIGRRISIVRKTEYLIFWKGYDINECSWSLSTDVDSPEALDEFDERCFALRKARRANSRVESIDRFVNEGMATLVDEGAEIYANNKSPFDDEMDDFVFAGDQDPHSVGDKSKLLAQVATHGWNRACLLSMVNRQITKICGTINDLCGPVYYLCKWDDKATSWECADNVGRVLRAFENARFATERKALVRLYRRSKQSADPSMVATREPKYMLEKTPVKEHLARSVGSLFDMGTSLLRGADEPIQIASSPVRISRTSSDTPLTEMLKDEKPAREASETPLTELLAQATPIEDRSATPLIDTFAHATPIEDRSATPHIETLKDLRPSTVRLETPLTDTPTQATPIRDRSDTPLTETLIRDRSDMPSSTAHVVTKVRPKSTAYVYINHTEGSRAKRRRTQRNDDSDVEMAEDEVAMPAMGRATDTKCGLCMVDVSVTVDGPLGHCSCTECGISYHNPCFTRLAERLELGPAYIATLSQTPQSFVCWFCREYAVQVVDEYITWRGGQNVLGGRAVSLGRVDVAVKWKNMSYRHVAWVPFVWLSTTRRSMALRSMKMQVQVGARAPLLEDRVDSAHTQPAHIIGAKKADVRSVTRRMQQLRASSTKVAENDWTLFAEYDAVWVAWKGLDISDATWEAPPSPLSDADDYGQWHKVFRAWQRAEHVSVNKRPTGLVEHTEQIAKVEGGVLKPYQVDGAKWLVQKWTQGKSAVLADEMGMGKTIQTIAFLLTAYRSTIDQSLSTDGHVNSGTFPFLVVVPTTLVANWAREFSVWGPELVVAELSGRAASRDLQLEHTLFRRSKGRRDLKCHVVLTSYEALNHPAACSSMRSIAWQSIIVDEGHRLKNDQTKTFQTLAQFSSRMRLVLTGTPLQNHLKELHSVMSFVDPRAFTSSEVFSVETPEQIERTKDMVRPYILRRTKAELPKLVPPRHELILHVSMTRLQRELYRATLSRNVRVLRDISAALQATGDVSDASEETGKGRLRSDTMVKQPKKPRVSSLNNILMEVRKIVSHPYCIADVEPEFPDDHERHTRLIDACGKLKLLHVLLPELKLRGHRVLLFAQFKDTLSILEDYLDGEGIGCVRIDGDTPAVDRQSRVTAFNDPQSSAMVFLASTRTGGLGLNLTSADVVIIYDCDFNPHADLQAMARAHRIGQTKPVYVFKLVTQDTAEERIVEMATRKLVLDHLVIQNMHNVDVGHAEHGRVEQALRHGASRVFGEDAQADERTIVYDTEMVRALLDQCKRVVEAEQQKAMSAPEDFSRVWVADTDGSMHEAVDTVEDTESDVWAQLLARTDQSSSVVQLPTEDVNGRSLRVRKHKVDYVVNDTKRKSGPVDAEFVPDEIELMEPHIVTKDDLLSIVSMHRKRLLASYTASEVQTVEQLHDVETQFAALANGRRVQPGNIPGSGSPDLYFPIPANIRLRMGVQVPEQPMPSCPMCTTPHGHSFCPFITDPSFISAVRSIKQIPGFWRHTHFHNFIAWYTVQYVWFVLVHEEGESVHKANMRARPEYMVDAGEYVREARVKREMKTKDAAANKLRCVHERALKEQQEETAYSAFYESFAGGGSSLDLLVDLQRPTKQPVRSYVLASLDSPAYTKFCDMLAGSHVDLCKVNDVEWLQKHLEWLCAYRVKLIQSGRAAVEKREFVSVGDQAMGLRFISMRAEQVRLRIDDLNSKRSAVQEQPKQTSALTNDLQTYVTRLLNLQCLVSQSTNAQPVHIVTQYIEQTRNYCAGVLAKLGPPGQGMKVVAGLVKKHDLAVAQGVGAREASVEVNRAVRELYAEVKAASATKPVTPVTKDVVMEPAVRPVVHKQHHLATSVAARPVAQQQMSATSQSAVPPIVQQQQVPATLLPVARPTVQQQMPATSQSTVQPATQQLQIPAALLSTARPKIRLQMPATSLSAAAPSLSTARPMVQQQIPTTSLSTVQPLTLQQQIPATSIYSQALTLQQMPATSTYSPPLTLQQIPATSIYSQPIVQQHQMPATSLLQSLTQQMPATSIYSQAQARQQMPAASIYSPPIMSSATMTTSPIPSAPMLSAQSYQQLPQARTVRSASFNHLPLSTSQSGLVQLVSDVSMAPMSAHVISPSPLSNAGEFSEVGTSALLSGAQHAEALARQQQMQQYYYTAADKPLDAGSPFMMTPPDSSLIRCQTAEQMARAPASYDLACLLCDSPHHIQSACPSRKDLGALTRRRVAVESNAMLAPGIRETTLCVIDQYLQAVFTNR